MLALKGKSSLVADGHWFGFPRKKWHLMVLAGFLLGPET